MKLILGSQSKSRQEVLIRAGIAFEAIAADIDEKAIRTDDYEQLPLLLARAKADKLLTEVTEPALLVTADTVTTFHGELREKPTDPAQARQFLESYSEEEPIKVITGISVVNMVTRKRVEGVDIATLELAKLPQELIEELVLDVVTYTMAGGFTVYDLRIAPYMTVLSGSFENVAGLPLELMNQLIAEATR